MKRKKNVRSMHKICLVVFCLGGIAAMAKDNLNKEELRKKLDPLQYKVTQEDGTELPFKNKYWDNHEAGIYVDIVSGEPLFSSLDKYDSQSGWPSFTKPIEKAELIEKEDRKLFNTRTEVRSKGADSHLGHVFNDGPGPNGLRYCINSAALRFIPVSQLKEQGYGQYLPLFERNPSTQSAPTEVAIFGAGCFWGVEDILMKVPGVVKTTSGYDGGNVSNPTYEQVSSGRTGHAEVVRVEYDPKKVTYEKLLEYFFRLHDPTTLNRQGPDVGTQYRSVIFAQNKAQREAAEAFKKKAQTLGHFKNPIVTEIVEGGEFFSAEDYHQKYYQKTGGKAYCHYLREW